MVSWCAPQSITLTLPKDDPPWQFHWSDSKASRQRTVDSAGTYAFEITLDQCTFLSAFEVVEDINCDTDECILSIPTNGTSLRIPAEVWRSPRPRVYDLAVEYEDKEGRVQSEWSSITVVK